MAAGEELLIVLLFYKFLQYGINLIDIQGYRWLRILGIEGSIGIGIAIALHAL